MLRDLTEKVSREIEKEKRSREDTEETLIGLLEDACNKLEGFTA